MKAVLKNYRQSPRKVRLVAGLIKGKSVPVALAELSFLVKRAGNPLQKILQSAVANAKTNDGIEADKLFVKSVLVDKGMVLRRVERKARGSANVLHKRASNITIILDTKKEVAVKKGKSTKKVTSEKK